MNPSNPLSELFDARLPAGLGGRWYGVFPALVTDIKDPDGQGRVKISLPWSPDAQGAACELWARLFGDADHPGAPSAVGKESAHRRAEVGVQQFAIFRVPDERQIAAKHAAIVLRTFDGDRLMHRSARGETDETRDVHARQGLRDRSRG